MSDELTPQQRDLLHRLFNGPNAPELDQFGYHLQYALTVISSAAFYIQDILAEPSSDSAEDAKTIDMMLDMILETSMEWAALGREMNIMHQKRTEDDES